MDLRQKLRAARYYMECPREDMAERLGITIEQYKELEDGELGKKISDALCEAEVARYRRERERERSARQQEFVAPPPKTDWLDTLEHPLMSIVFTCFICLLVYLVHWVCCE